MSIVTNRLAFIGVCIVSNVMAKKLTSVKHTYWGRFENPWDTWEDTRLRAGLALTFTSGDPDCAPAPSDPRLIRDLPVHRPKFGPSGLDEVRLTWLGHSSVMLAIDGVYALFDPIFSDRCSASRYIGPLRYRPPPCKVDDLPEINAIFLSHNHYDHMDVTTIEQLGKRFPRAYWFVPKGCASFVQGTIQGLSPHQVFEASWWDESPIGNTNVKVVFTPSQHWSARNFIFDSFGTLWGGWAVAGPKHRAWFAGDTGYCPVFTEIGDHLGPFDVAAIPIGAYKPRHLLKSQHVDPYEAVQIHRDVKANHSVAIHWGTFPLAHESYLAPQLELQKAVIAAGLGADAFRTIEHGQSLVYRRRQPPDEDELIVE